MSIVINDFVGYMLGRNNAPAVGQPWWPCDAWTFVCRDLGNAQRIIDMEPDKNRWTHIYRVRAPKIEFETVNAGIYWTKMSNSLIVDGVAWVVPHARPRFTSEEELLLNARKCRAAWSRLFNVFKEK